MAVSTGYRACDHFLKFRIWTEFHKKRAFIRLFQLKLRFTYMLASTYFTHLLEPAHVHETRLTLPLNPLNWTRCIFSTSKLNEIERNAQWSSRLRCQANRIVCDEVLNLSSAGNSKFHHSKLFQIQLVALLQFREDLRWLSLNLSDS